MAKIVFVTAMMPVILTVGCTNGNAEFMSEQRSQNGLVVILPGIEGESGLNHGIRNGLVQASVDRAIPIWPWGRPVPLLGLLINQVDFLGNRLAGAGIAKRIAKYQDKYPGKPVHVIGHSGGGGVAVFVAEYMPKDHKLDGLILLSASISSAYDLTKALNNCREGIVNYYSREDVGLLAVGTTVLGTVDGTHGPSAGLLGFDKPRRKDKAEKKDAYRKLTQIRLDVYGAAHEICASAGFISTRVAKHVMPGGWPASHADEGILARTDLKDAMLGSAGAGAISTGPQFSRPERSMSPTTIAKARPQPPAPPLEVRPSPTVRVTRARRTASAEPRIFKPIAGLGRRSSPGRTKAKRLPRFNAVKYKLRPS